MTLTPQEISQIATRTADEVIERVREPMDIRDLVLGSAMGEGAIPLYGRETRKEPCSCCLIDPVGPNEPENRMCTTKGAIGTLSDREEREWCSEINIVSDGRCARAMSIREAARECKEKHPSDTEAFFRCYIPAFSQITKRGSNPSLVSEDPLKEKYISELIKLEIILGLLEADLTQMSKRAKELARMTWDELVEYSRSLSSRTPSVKGGNNPSLISSIVAATVTMQKLEEERRKKKAERGW